MSESLTHMNYVRRMVKYINTIPNEYSSALLYADLPEYVSRTPKIIGGYFPDLFYKSLKEIIIGEAKTENDIENQHTDDQLNSYIEEVMMFEGEKHIVLCSSVMSFALLKNKIIRKKRKEKLDEVKFHILDNFQRVSII